ncbi:MAG TPA: tyrosine-type recombinase/integrase [Afifellaceae bacterium]|nr:tyrosine-type recombinase/integrase [Afifellaceae bacterium]
MPKLTKSVIERAEPDPAREVFLWDTVLPGFGVRIYPSGKRKYLVQYRTRDNRQRRAVIGAHGVLTAEQARDLARDMLAAVAKGGDPAAEQKAAREAPTVRELADDYLERHAIPNKRPSSVADDRAMLQRMILPKLGPAKVAAVTRRDIEKLHNGLRQTPYAANRLLALLNKMFNLAVAWGWRPDNPVKGIPRFHEDRRQRWLSDDELQRLWSVLEQHPNRRAANAVKLMILTGARRSEVLGASWDQFDLERGFWSKPSHHTKQKKAEHVPLSGAARALVSAMRGEADPESPFLFPGDAPDKPLGDIKKFWGRVCKEAGIEGVRLHDLRHTYASSLVSRGVSLHIVGRLLGHTQPQTTARYAHLDDRALRDAADQFGASVASATPAAVTPLHPTAAE